MRRMPRSGRAASSMIGLAAALLLVSAGSAGAQGGTDAAGSQAVKDPAPPASPKPYYRFQDNSISLLPYGWGYKVDPSEQASLTLEHVHNSAIGDLFVFVNGTKFYNADAGDEEWTAYGEVSARLSLGKISGKDLSFTTFPHSFFAVKDVLIAAQYERGEDPDVAEAVLLGLGFDLDAHQAGLLGPLGKFNYIQLNLYARAELTSDAQPGFRDMQITMVAAYPFKVGPARFLIDGYFDWVLGIGAEKWSYHLNPQIKLDLGAFAGRPKKLYVGCELDFWWNKYQIVSTTSFNTNQYAGSLLLKYHF